MRRALQQFAADAHSFEVGYMATSSLRQSGLGVQPTVLVVSVRDP